MLNIEIEFIEQKTGYGSSHYSDGIYPGKFTYREKTYGGGVYGTREYGDFFWRRFRKREKGGD